MQKSSEQKPIENPVISSAMSTENTTKITRLYNNAYATLAKYDHHYSGNIDHLFSLIAETTALKSSSITATDVGLFAYKQPSQWKEKLGEFPSGPLYVSVFFDRLNRYNELLIKNDFTHPTQKNYSDYLANKKTEEIQQKVMERAPSFGIYPEQNTKEENEALFVHIPEVIATQGFEKLTIDVHKIRNESLPVIKALADKLYAKRSKEEGPK